MLAHIVSAFSFSYRSDTPPVLKLALTLRPENCEVCVREYSEEAEREAVQYAEEKANMPLHWQQGWYLK